MWGQSWAYHVQVGGVGICRFKLDIHDGSIWSIWIWINEEVSLTKLEKCYSVFFLFWTWKDMKKKTHPFRIYEWNLTIVRKKFFAFPLSFSWHSIILSIHIHTNAFSLWIKECFLLWLYSRPVTSDSIPIHAICLK